LEQRQKEALMNSVPKQQLIERLKQVRVWDEPTVRAVLAFQKESGLSVSRFALQEGLEPRRLRKWVTNLKVRDLNRQLSYKQIQPTAESSSFVPVVLKGADVVSARACAVVHLSDGVRVELGRLDVESAAWLGLVFRALRATS
jgi:hypothetical protein